MRLGSYLSSLTKNELLELKENLNLTESEEQVFNGLSKGRSVIQVASDCCVCTSTVDIRIKNIKRKVLKVQKQNGIVSK